MALSQKHVGKILVPWYNSHEWKCVYSLIYGENSTNADKKKALKILHLWKIRMPTLFAGLEGTLIILSALLRDKEVFSKEELSNFYSLAIMRFLNLCAAHSDQQGTFFRVAKERKLPDWLVNIRHDLAHSQKQSSLFMLRTGLEYCFEWLRREYWEMQDRQITDFFIEQHKRDTQEQIKLYCKYVSARITGKKLKLPVLNLLKELKVNNKSDSRKILKKILRGNQLAIENISEFLIKDRHFFISIPGDLDQIPKQYLQGWEALLQCLQEHDLMIKLIQKLHNTAVYSESAQHQKISSLWLKEIFHALKSKMHNDEKLKSTEFHEPDCNLYTLNLEQPNSKLLKDIKKFSNYALETPHPYLEIYIARLLVLCSFKQSSVEDIEGIASFYFHPRTDLPNEYVPMTIENIKDAAGYHALDSLDCDESGLFVPDGERKWERICDTSIYEGCPIGTLPNQQRDYNPTISF